MDPNQAALELLAYQLVTDLLHLGRAIVAGEKAIIIETHTIHGDPNRVPVIEHRVVVR